VTDPGDRGGRPTIPEAVDASSLFAKGGGPKPVLVVLTGPQVGQRILLEAPAIVGRDPEADLMLFDPEVDWHHARVEPKDGGWVVVDLTGERRTEVNGMRVKELMLTPDDQIILGGTVVRFEVHDPVEQAYDEAVLERLYMDDLTGLLARRKFDIELSGALDAAARNDETLAMLVLDVDRLKPINDMHGHLVGSRVISEVGGLVRAVLQTRRLDRALACRLGGDEFGIAVPGLAAEAAHELAEAIRRAVAETPFMHDAEPLKVRVSGGLAFYPADGGTALELLRRADEALYRAKGAGGDRVAVHAPEPDQR